MDEPDDAKVVSYEQLHDFVARLVGSNSRGVRTLRYQTAKELHGNALLRRLVGKDAAREELDAATRQVVSDAVRMLGSGIQALVGIHPDTIGQSRPKRRQVARREAKLKDQGHFNSQIEPLYVDTIAEALGPMVGVQTSAGRQLQHEYEVLSRETEYIIDADNHLHVEHWTKVQIRALGLQVRLYNGVYKRKTVGRPLKPEILSNGHSLLGSPVLESTKDSWYFFGIFLGRRLGVGEEETIEYRSTFEDREVCEPYFWLGLHNPYSGHMQMTVRLPIAYIERGLLFRITNSNGEVDDKLWTQAQRFGHQRLPGAKVDLEPRRAVIRWTIRPAVMGDSYEVRWTNELVQTLDERTISKMGEMD